MVKTGAMTFLEAALDILKREGRPLHFKELTERAMTKKLLTFVGRTPEVTMQTQLTAAVKKAPGSPFVRVKPGVFGLLRYPELTAEEKERDKKEAAAAAGASEGRSSPRRDRAEAATAESGDGEESGGRRRRRRGGRTRGGKARPGDAQDEVKTSPKSAGKAASADEGEPGDVVRAPDLHDDGNDEAPEPGAGSGLSAAARAAALAETGVLEGDRDDTGHDEDVDGDGDDAEDGDDTDLDLAEGRTAEPADGEAGGVTATSPAQPGGSAEAAGGEGDEEGLEGDDDSGDEGDEGEGLPPATNAAGSPSAEGDELGRRRRRRRRRRRGGGDDDGRLDGNRGSGSGGDAAGTGNADRFASDGGRSASEPGPSSGSGGEGTSDGNFAATAPNGEAAAAGDAQQARKITTPVDAAIEILKSQPPGRGVHVRQLADSAIRRRLIHGEPNEAWRVIRTALAAEPKERLRSGQRPRVRAAGSGLYALARRPPDAELEKAEQVFGEARRALRERTMAALERRLAELSPGAFEAIARVLLQREGFGPTTFVKRVEGTIYVEALRGRGMRPAKCLIALRPGAAPAGRRAIGELRAGIRARNHDEGLLMLGGRLSDEAIAEWKQSGPPLEIADGPALAETCARHGVGVLTATVNVDFVDADFFSELVEG